MTKGFLYVGSVRKWFYNMACMSADSLRDVAPDANIVLYTHESFVDSRAKSFDQIITNIPYHSRAKMWCCARSPFDQTAYIDSDTLIVSDEVTSIFDEAKDNDIAFTPVLPNSAGRAEWQYADKEMKHQLSCHGGIYVSKKTELVDDFLQTWFDEFHKQITTDNVSLQKYYPRENLAWDMLTLWRLMNEEKFSRFKKLKISNELDTKFNYTPYNPVNNFPVITHYLKQLYRNMDKTNEIFALEEQKPDKNPIQYQ